MDAQQEFWRRLGEEWLPAYCNDPKRQYATEGFRAGSKTVSEQDARDFLRAIDQKVVSVDSGGRFRMPQSKAHEVIFWEHSTAISPRPVTLWLEPVITIAAVARLHLDYGWPVEYLGMQSADSAFDLMAFKPPNFDNEYIAGEVKDSAAQLDRLLAHMNQCCAKDDPECSARKTRKNAHRKVAGLKRCRAPVFWALGPDCDSRVFEVAYGDDGRIALHPSPEENLRFRPSKNA
jgi:hypothetical protein